MRVLFLSRSDAFSRWGGDTTQMIKTQAELEALGVSVSIALDTHPDLSGMDLVHVFNVQTASHSVKQVEYARRQGVPIVLSPIYWERSHIDAWHETYEFHAKATVRRLARLSPSIPAWYFSHCSPGRHRLVRDIKHMLQTASHVLPNSIAELEILISTFELSQLRAKSSVVVNAVEIDDPSPSTPSGGEVTLPSGDFVLQVGRFEPIKGQRSLIRSLMHDAEIPLVFVGAGIDSDYGQACQHLGAERGNVHFLPPLPHSALPAVYRKAKVHALPSMRESPGLVTLEAALQGANCVVSVHAPLQEYFGELAWVCDPTSDASIRQAVLLALHSERSGALGKYIRHHFTWQHAARQTLKAYEQTLGFTRPQHE